MKEIILIDEKSPLEIYYDQGGDITVFDETNAVSPLERTVVITNHTKVHWYGIASGNSTYSLKFVTQSDESIVRILLLSRAEDKLSMTVHSTLTQSHTLTNIYILSLVGEAGTILLNGTVQIDSGIEKVKGHILEENIFLGSKGNIRGIPSLMVHSDDVEAGHAARIERVSDEKLYYLRARGIPKDDATVMMIESAVFGLLDGLNEDYKESIFQKVRTLF